MTHLPATDLGGDEPPEATPILGAVLPVGIFPNAPGCEPGAPPYDSCAGSNPVGVARALAPDGIPVEGSRPSAGTISAPSSGGSFEHFVLSCRAVGAAAPTLYRFASVRSRTDTPSVADLEADGWQVEHVDPRYGTRLMRKEGA